MSHRLLPGNPELYHGTKTSRPYFEGWYFKLISPSGTFKMAVIPGISKSIDENDDHCFLQIFVNNRSWYIRYPIEFFESNTEKFDIKIGLSKFSMDGFSLNIHEDDLNIECDIKYKTHKKLVKKPFYPSIMGPFSYVPGMQCNHGVLSLFSTMEGTIKLNGKILDVADFIGYIEKDWGEAFPSSWLWLQGSGLQGIQPFSCMCSIATIPYGPMNFRGLIAVILAGGKQYRFATYNFTKVKKFTTDGNRVEVILRKFAFKLLIRAATERNSILKAPVSDGMSRNISESLDAVISFELSKRGKIIFKGVCDGGGLETSETGKVLKK